MSDFIDVVKGAVDAAVRTDADARGQLGIGELVALLRACDPSKPVTAVINGNDFDVSADVMSYRGYYSQLAIEPGHGIAGALADRLDEAIGATFEGYKGGCFTMSRNTPVWVSEYGSASGWAITGVDGTGATVSLEITVEEW